MGGRAARSGSRLRRMAPRVQGYDAEGLGLSSQSEDERIRGESDGSRSRENFINQGPAGTDHGQTNRN